MAQSNSMREKVRDLAQKEVEAIIGSGAWLNDDISFSHCYQLIGTDAIQKAKGMLDLLVPIQHQTRYLQQKLIDTNILCANLLLSEQYCKPISISLSPNTYVRNCYIKASPFTIKLVNLLHEQAFIEKRLGYHNTKEPKESRKSRFWPCKIFLDYFSPIPQIDYEPIELVNLRDSTKKNIDYKDTEETIHIRNVLRTANIVNRRALIGVQSKRGFERISTDLHAVFSVSFDRGGRIYTGRDGYQSLKNRSGGRKDIVINGMPTVELDYSGLHPRLLYALEGIQFNNDPYECFDEKIRKFSKCLLLALLNAKSIGRAVSYGYNERYDDYELYQTLEALGTNPKEMIELFCKTHLPIAKHFGKEIGMTLMNIDSKIALDVVEHFTKRGMPILAIHDSFIVQSHLNAELQGVMQKAYC